jgi:trk system potassium uptake protein TrkH
MLMGMLNFLTSYALLRRQVRRAGRNTEVRLAAALIPLFSVILLFGVTLGLYPTLGKSVRVAVFETVTALSTTGFATVDYRPWNGLGWLILILLMMIGGGTGSTAGAIKQYRIYVMLQALVWEVRRALMPGRAVSRPYVWQGERKEYLTDERVRQVGVFVFLYVATYFAGSMVLAWHGYTLPESLFEFASALGTVGLSVGVTMPDAPPAVLWSEMAGMFLGRLEFFTILIGIAKIAADSRRLVR